MKSVEDGLFFDRERVKIAQAQKMSLKTYFPSAINGIYSSQIDGESPGRRMKEMTNWNGWKISVEVYGGDFDTLDEAKHFTNFLEGFLAKRFPGAKVGTWCTAGVEGPGAECTIELIDGEANYEDQRYADVRLEDELHEAGAAFEYV